MVQLTDWVPSHTFIVFTAGLLALLPVPPSTDTLGCDGAATQGNVRDVASQIISIQTGCRVGSVRPVTITGL